MGCAVFLKSPHFQRIELQLMIDAAGQNSGVRIEQASELFVEKVDAQQSGPALNPVQPVKQVGACACACILKDEKPVCIELDTDCCSRRFEFCAELMLQAAADVPSQREAGDAHEQDHQPGEKDSQPVMNTMNQHG